MSDDDDAIYLLIVVFSQWIIYFQVNINIISRLCWRLVSFLVLINNVSFSSLVSILSLLRSVRDYRWGLYWMIGFIALNS
jgi:hypothetical protein